MIKLDEANEFAAVGTMLNGVKLSTYQVQKRKFLYIEGLIRFLELYARNEIGDVEVDIEKVALWVNSSAFENVDVYQIKSIQGVYKSITDDLVERNVPLYRFLRLSDYQFKILEREHYDLLLQDFEKDCTKYPCLKCLWYEAEETAFGRLSKCKLPKSKITNKVIWGRQGYHDITLKKNRQCKYCTTAEGKDEFVRKYITPIKSDYDRSYLLEQIDERYDSWVKKVQHLDNSYIPLRLPETMQGLLSVEADALKELGRAFRGLQTVSEMQKNLRFAIILECMIRFVELYAQTEMGTDYEASISRIARYVYDISCGKDTDILSFKSREELYKRFEDIAVENDAFFNGFVQRKGI